jgi:putative ABC transport system permease protein
MSFWEIFKEGLGVLSVNKLRTGLSILGIIIGISSVIILMTLGKASQKSTLDRISALGSDILTIRPGGRSGNPFGQGNRNVTTLKEADAESIKNDKRVSNIADVASEYSGNLQVIYNKVSSNVSVTGVSENYFDIRNIKITAGNVFSSQDLNSKVAILGPATADTLFGTENPVGKNININGHNFMIVGITESKGSAGRLNLDEAVYIPLNTAQDQVFGVSNLSAIYVKVSNVGIMTQTQNQLGFLLLEKHRIAKITDADFNISSSQEILQTVTDVTSTFTSLLAGIAAISLVVGGIGIMNIMIVTVNERTREIGIRKALGAKRREITTQFLIEASILTIIGGLIGVLLGTLISILLSLYLNLPQLIDTTSIFLAVAVSSGIGVIFGWYPANQASKLQPIEALRYE